MRKIIAHLLGIKIKTEWDRQVSTGCIDVRRAQEAK